MAEPPAEPLAEGQQLLTPPMEQPEATLAFLRAEKVALTSAPVGEQPNLHLISSIDQDIRCVKCVSTTIVVPAEPLLAETTLVELVAEELVVTEPAPSTMVCLVAIPCRRHYWRRLSSVVVVVMARFSTHLKRVILWSKSQESWVFTLKMCCI